MARALLHHRLSGPEDAPLLVLGPSLGTSMTVWEPELPRLEAEFRVLLYDLPGHGGSPTGLLPHAEPGRTTMDDLAALVLDLVNHHNRGAFHCAGISLGGAIGAHLAVKCPDYIRTLTMVCSSAHFGPAQPWRDRAELVRREGTAALLAATPRRWFATPDTAASELGRALLNNLEHADPIGYAACCDALADYDLSPECAPGTRTLVIGGSRDVATPVHHAKELAERTGATLMLVESGHLAVEQPEAVAHAIAAHIRSVAGPSR